MKAQMCRFKRSAGASWEVGVIVDNDKDFEHVLVDEEGKVVEKAHNFVFTPEHGCFETVSEARLRRIYSDAERAGMSRARQRPGDGDMGG